jgi:hypothetical protein
LNILVTVLCRSFLLAKSFFEVPIDGRIKECRIQGSIIYGKSCATILQELRGSLVKVAQLLNRSCATFERELRNFTSGATSVFKTARIGLLLPVLNLLWDAKQTGYNSFSDVPVGKAWTNGRNISCVLCPSGHSYP